MQCPYSWALGKSGVTRGSAGSSGGSGSGQLQLLLVLLAELGEQGAAEAGRLAHAKRVDFSVHTRWLAASDLVPMPGTLQ